MFRDLPGQYTSQMAGLHGAEALKELDTCRFEWWAVDLVGARPARDRKKGADSGLDGYIYFLDDNRGVAKKVVVQVKIGHVAVNLVRDLKGVIEREKAAKTNWQVTSGKKIVGSRLHVVDGKAERNKKGETSQSGLFR